jgi:broad specificity phosphatase PhoE
MAMPNDLVFIRHGQSEANTVQRDENHGYDESTVRALFRRPDWQHRLTSRGIEQARQAKHWLDENLGGLESFDALYVSPFYRTRETAAHIGGPDLGGWTIDDRVVERSWGVYGKRPTAEQRALFPMTVEEKAQNPWYTRLDGGESMPDVYSRFRDFQGTLHREQSGKRVCVVSHGDFMNAARYGIERMTPEEWEKIDADRAYALQNCTILHYTRVNPNDPNDVQDKLHWRRYIYPGDIEHSPFGGQWVELSDRRRYTGEELISQATAAERLTNI